MTEESVRVYPDTYRSNLGGASCSQGPGPAAPDGEGCERCGDPPASDDDTLCRVCRAFGAR